MNEEKSESFDSIQARQMESLNQVSREGRINFATATRGEDRREVMRIVVSYEEHTSDIPMVLLEGSLKWDEGAFYPVTWGNDFSSVKNFLGSVSDIRREDDGVITCEFTPNGQFVLLEKDIWATASATIYASQVAEEKHDGYRVVSSCQLASIFFSMGVPWNSRLED